MNEIEHYQKEWKETKDSSFSRQMFAAQHLVEPWNNAKNFEWDGSKQELRFDAAYINQDDIDWIIQITGLEKYQIDAEGIRMELRFRR